MSAPAEVRQEFVEDPLYRRLEKQREQDVGVRQCSICRQESDSVERAAKEGCNFVADPEWAGVRCHAVCDEGAPFCPRHAVMVANLGMKRAQTHERVEAKVRLSERSRNNQQVAA